MEDRRTARDILIDYMSERKMRKTAERFDVLEDIYAHPRHFTAEALFDSLTARGKRLTLATVYNTIALLLDCGLLTRHCFDGRGFVYEPTYHIAPHDHFICERCGRVTELVDGRVADTVRECAADSAFMVHSHRLYVYGVCKKCQRRKSFRE